MAITDFHRRKQ